MTPLQGWAHFEALEKDHRLVDAFFDFSKTVLQASGFQKDFTDGDKVLIGFSGFIETRQKSLLGLTPQGLVRVTDQQGFFGFRQVA